MVSQSRFVLWFWLLYILILVISEPPSPNVTLDTEIDFSVLGPQVAVRKIVSTTDNDYCYMYV